MLSQGVREADELAIRTRMVGHPQYPGNLFLGRGLSLGRIRGLGVPCYHRQEGRLLDRLSPGLKATLPINRRERRSAARRLPPPDPRERAAPNTGRLGQASSVPEIGPAALGVAGPGLALATVIRAPRARVFDLARSIDAHQDSTGSTEARAVAGVTKGLVGMDDEVTWEARHFRVRQRLTVRITAFDRPNRFQDVMISGAFKGMVHDHEFAKHPTGTLMRDRFEFESPLGILGRAADWLCLTSYMRRFLVRRNEVLKQLAESSEWSRCLEHT
jgi:ligand-binding SRPBCC domain-containing protein